MMAAQMKKKLYSRAARVYRDSAVFLSELWSLKKSVLKTRAVLRLQQAWLFLK
jgi:hypothetical protein